MCVWAMTFSLTSSVTLGKSLWPRMFLSIKWETGWDNFFGSSHLWHSTKVRMTQIRKISGFFSWTEEYRTNASLRVTFLKEWALPILSRDVDSMFCQSHAWNQGTLIALFMEGLRIWFSDYFIVRRKSKDNWGGLSNSWGWRRGPSPHSKAKVGSLEFCYQQRDFFYQHSVFHLVSRPNLLFRLRASLKWWAQSIHISVKLNRGQNIQFFPAHSRESDSVSLWGDPGSSIFSKVPRWF